jgi:uncharacterized membrane protein
MKKSGDGLARVAMPIGRHVSNLWRLVHDSLWFVPALFVIGAVVLGIAMVEISSIVPRQALETLPRLFGAGASGSRGMLSTIAGAMVTVAGVTFSITVVAVAQASSMYTPRILRNFMRDRPSQLVLGMLVGTFVYCLVVIRTIRGQEDARFIPAIAVLMAFVLAIAAMGFLIYFIHHIAGSLQASQILARVSRETIASIDRLFPEEIGADPAEAGASAVPLPPDDAWRSVPARRSGYLQHVDADDLLRFARDRDIVVRLDCAVGSFCIEGTPLVSVTNMPPSDEDEALLNGMFTQAAFRTVEQDAAFGIQQIVDIALRALSPGVNDATTALHCIDHIGVVLVRLAPRRVEEPYRLENGVLRVIAHGPTFTSLLEAAIADIRRNARDNVTVHVHLLAMLGRVGTCTPNPERRRLLVHHVEAIRRTAAQAIPLAEDRRMVNEACDRARRTLGAIDDGSVHPTLVRQQAAG